MPQEDIISGICGDKGREHGSNYRVYGFFVALMLVYDTPKGDINLLYPRYSLRASISLIPYKTPCKEFRLCFFPAHSAQNRRNCLFQVTVGWASKNIIPPSLKSPLKQCGNAGTSIETETCIPKPFP